MRTIDNLSDDANQQVQVLLDDGSLVSIALRYLPTGQRWVATISRNDFTVAGLGLCQHPNILRSYRNLIPFGLMVSSIDAVDPAYIQDWVNGRCSLQILDAADVAAVESQIIGADA